MADVAATKGGGGTVLGTYRVGGWQFEPASGELVRGGERRRLEPRAVKVLELLCAAEGGVVSHETLIGTVWNGRAVSENSVAVVIGQLRRALDDDAREPRLIETMPKRGYRLGANGGRAGAMRGWRLALVLALILLLVGVAVFGGRTATQEISVGDVRNETGDPRYDPLARATSELIVAQLGKREFAVRRDAEPAALRLDGKLVIWNGEPYLGLTVTDREGVIRWSAMTPGSAGRIPTGVATELDRFERSGATR